MKSSQGQGKKGRTYLKEDLKYPTPSQKAPTRQSPRSVPVDPIPVRLDLPDEIPADLASELKSSKDITCDTVDIYMQLLRQLPQATHISGLRRIGGFSVAYSDTLPHVDEPLKLEGCFVQPIHAAGHYFVLSNRFLPPEEQRSAVCVYDSLGGNVLGIRSRLSAMKLAASKALRCRDDHFSLYIMDVVQQVGNDCGVFAAIFTSLIVQGLDPSISGISTDSGNLRNALLQSLYSKETDRLLDFVLAPPRVPIPATVLEVPLICDCRLPQPDNAAEFSGLTCSTCSSLWHTSCISTELSTGFLNQWQKSDKEHFFVCRNCVVSGVYPADLCARSIERKRTQIVSSLVAYDPKKDTKTRQSRRTNRNTKPKRSNSTDAALKVGPKKAAISTASIYGLTTPTQCLNDEVSVQFVTSPLFMIPF